MGGSITQFRVWWDYKIYISVQPLISMRIRQARGTTTRMQNTWHARIEVSPSSSQRFLTAIIILKSSRISLPQTISVRPTRKWLRLVQTLKTFMMVTTNSQIRQIRKKTSKSETSGRRVTGKSFQSGQYTSTQICSTLCINGSSSSSCEPDSNFYSSYFDSSFNSQRSSSLSRLISSLSLTPVRSSADISSFFLRTPTSSISFLA